MAVGVVLLMIGFVLVAMNYPTVQNLQTSLGQVGRIVNQSLEQQYQQALTITYVGGFLGLFGFILLIAGAVMSPSATQPPTSIRPLPIAVPASDDERAQQRRAVERNLVLTDECPKCGEQMIDQGNRFYCLRDDLLVHKASGTILSDLPSSDLSFFDQEVWVPKVGNRLISLTSDAILVSNDDGKLEFTLPLNKIRDVTVEGAEGHGLRISSSSGEHFLTLAKPGPWRKEILLRENQLSQKLRPTPISPSTEPSKAKAVAKVVSKTKFCRECGAPIPRDSKFCEECGTKLV
jgi:ribosomal protein S27AE